MKYYDNRSFEEMDRYQTAAIEALRNRVKELEQLLKLSITELDSLQQVYIAAKQLNSSVSIP